VILGIVFAPLQRLVMMKLNRRRNISSLVTLTTALLIAILPVIIISALLVQEGAVLYKNIESGQLDVAGYIDQFKQLLPASGQQLLDRMGMGDLEGVRDKVAKGAMQGSQYFATQAFSFGQGTLDFVISFGIMLGAFGLFLVDRKVSGASPEMLVGTVEHPVIPPRIWLFVFAIIAHNIPEGMAVGVSAGGGMPDADSLAMGIALQDVPEGLVIALVLAGAGMSRVKAFLIGAASGLVEPVFALLGAWLVSLAEMLLPLGLALAAGAMLLVVTHEVIPESRRHGHDKLASLGLLIGFCLMMVMDTALA
jgi:zinc transporter ZupT